MLIFKLCSFQTGKSSQTHLDNRIGLGFGKTESFHELCLCFLRILAAADDADDFIDIIKRYEQSL